MYKQIVNPATGRKVNVNGKLAKKFSIIIITKLVAMEQLLKFLMHKAMI